MPGARQLGFCCLHYGSLLLHCREPGDLGVQSVARLTAVFNLALVCCASGVAAALAETSAYSSAVRLTAVFNLALVCFASGAAAAFVLAMEVSTVFCNGQ